MGDVVLGGFSASVSPCLVVGLLCWAPESEEILHDA